MNKINQGIQIQLWGAKYHICIERAVAHHFFPSHIRKIKRSRQDDGIEEQIVVKMNLRVTHPKVCERGVEKLSSYIVLFDSLVIIILVT